MKPVASAVDKIVISNKMHLEKTTADPSAVNFVLLRPVAEMSVVSSSSQPG